MSVLGRPTWAIFDVNLHQRVTALARTPVLLLVSRNRYGFTLTRYRNEKSATDPALIHIFERKIHFVVVFTFIFTCFKRPGSLFLTRVLH